MQTMRVNGKVLLPFAAWDLDERYSFPTPYTDPDGKLGLSAKQKARFGGWKRPSAFMTAPRMIDVVSPFAIKQVRNCHEQAGHSLGCA